MLRALLGAVSAASLGLGIGIAAVRLPNPAIPESRGVVLSAPSPSLGPSPDRSAEAKASATTPSSPATAEPQLSPRSGSETFASSEGGLEVRLTIRPSESSPGQDVEFLLEVADSDGTVTSVAFDFGDGEGQHSAAALPACPSPPSGEPSPSDDELRAEHAYQEPGHYRVSVTVHTRSCSGDAERVTVIGELDVR